jgi:hypothetical protein
MYSGQWSTDQSHPEVRNYLQIFESLTFLISSANNVSVATQVAGAGGHTFCFEVLITES